MQVRSLPYGANTGDHSGQQNINSFTQQYIQTVAQTSTAQLFTESASNNQHLNPVISMPALPATWAGLQSVIPMMLTLGLLQYPFVMPDVIGGSVLGSDWPRDEEKEELFIRWLELSAFLPMMQFSTLPVDYGENVIQITKKYTDLHSSFVTPAVIRLLEQSPDSPQPIVRPLWHIAPDDPIAHGITDQFIIGDNIMVAPILKSGVRSRDIYFPEGVWDDSLTDVDHIGPNLVRNFPVALNELAYVTWESPWYC